MSASDDYCDLCDLPRSQCVHGRPAPVAAPAPKPRAKRSPSAPAPGVASKPVVRRWTPPEELKPHILLILEDAGGELDVEDVYERLEARLEGAFRAGDREMSPSGELRWHYAARRARQQLADEGLISKGRRGTWTLA